MNISFRFFFVEVSMSTYVFAIIYIHNIKLLKESIVFTEAINTSRVLAVMVKVTLMLRLFIEKI